MQQLSRVEANDSSEGSCFGYSPSGFCWCVEPYPASWPPCDFTAFEIKCSAKWQKSLRILWSALPDGKLLRCLPFCLQGGARFINRAHRFHSGESLPALLPTKLTKHWFFNPGAHYPASSWLGPQRANIYIYLFRKSFLFCRPSAESFPLGWKDYHVIIHLQLQTQASGLLCMRVGMAAGTKGWHEHFVPTKMTDHRLCKLWIQLSCKHAFPQVGADPAAGQPHSGRPEEGAPLIVYLILVIHHMSSQLLQSQGCFIH